jgi:serine/threonine-protein kinase
VEPGNDAQRWAQVLSTFEEIVDLDADSQAERLRQIAASDPERRRRLEELLAADANAESRLGRVEVALGPPVADDTGRQRVMDPLTLVGRTVSHFHVIAPLALGGMGVVYRAEDIRLRRPIALKFPLPSYHVDRDAKARFLREARLAGAFDHPNVCGIYEAGETEEGQLFYAMPLYDGETLKARLDREGTLPAAAALDIARQIAQGLSAAHKAGIIHRDLKPANVMLLPDGTVKILDFGLAKAVDVSLTASRIMMGTASYMAPEQILGRQVDARTDLWALGVVLYEMLTGRRPFQAAHDFSVAYAILHEEPAPPSALQAEIPAPVQELVLTLLRKEPTERYASAVDVGLALAGAAGTPIAAPARSTTQSRDTSSVRTRLRAHAPALYLTVVLLVALAAGVWLVRGKTATTPGLRSVAVLPFEELGDDDVRYLAAGLSDAISDDLLRTRAITVPGYSSTTRYRPTSKALPDVAAELEASAVVTGRVERRGNRLRVDAALFDANDNRTIWSKRYEGHATAVHDIQRNVTRALVDALGVDLESAERAMLERPLTANAQAYDLYLRGRDVELRASPRMPIVSIQEAQSFYARARDLDPSFAAARARLATMLLRGATTYDTTHARREQARLEAETALRLQPGLPAAHAALGTYWSLGASDVPKAIDHMEQAVASSPNSADPRVFLAQLYRDAGRWEDAIAQYRRAMELDARNIDAPMQAAFTLVRLRRDEEAMRALDRAIALMPEPHFLEVIKGHTYLRWKGTTDTLAAILRRIPADWDPGGMATWARYTVLRVERRDRDAIAMLATSRRQLSRDGLVYQPVALMRAQSYESLGELAKARAEYEAARAVLMDSLAAHPRDASIRASLGLAYAGLGRKSDAVREARRAMELAPVSQNSPGATAFMGMAVEVFGRVGERDEAFKLLELLLAMPAGREVTVPFLRVWPGFDPLRSDPRFRQLVERFATS